MLRKLDTLQRIEIAEGVEIQLHVAGPLPRGIAFALDVIVRGLIFGLVMLAESFLADLIFPEIFADPKVQGGMALLLWFVLDFGYFICFEASDRGATPGKRWLGLKVVRPSGVPASNSAVSPRSFSLSSMLRLSDSSRSETRSPAP